MSKDIINEIQTLEQVNINLLPSIQDDNINSITKELLITKQQSVQQETVLLKKHLNILQHDTISSKQIDEAIYTLENHTIPRLMNILINVHIFLLLEQPDMQNILSKEVSQ